MCHGPHKHYCFIRSCPPFSLVSIICQNLEGICVHILDLVHNPNLLVRESSPRAVRWLTSLNKTKQKNHSTSAFSFIIFVHPFKTPMGVFIDGEINIFLCSKRPNPGSLGFPSIHFSKEHEGLAWSIRNKKYLLFLRLGQHFPEIL